MVIGREIASGLRSETRDFVAGLANQGVQRLARIAWDWLFQNRDGISYPKNLCNTYEFSGGCE